MPVSIVLHLQGSEPVLGEVDELPGPGDRLIKLNHPRRMDGKDLDYIHEGVDTVIWSLEKVNFIEILPGEEEEEIIGFVRD